MNETEKQGSAGPEPLLFFTVEEAAKLLRIKRSAAYAAVKRGQIPTLRLGRKIIVPKGGLQKLAGCSIP